MRVRLDEMSTSEWMCNNCNLLIPADFGFHLTNTRVFFLLFHCAVVHFICFGACFIHIFTWLPIACFFFSLCWAAYSCWFFFCLNKKDLMWCECVCARTSRTLAEKKRSQTRNQVKRFRCKKYRLKLTLRYFSVISTFDAHTHTRSARFVGSLRHIYVWILFFLFCHI